MSITLVDLNADNWRECADLQVAEGQENFVAPNVRSIAQSRFIPGIQTKAIYADDAMVGFVMYRYNEERELWWISRFMIDKRYQGKGYGRAAMNEILSTMEEEHPGKRVGLSYEPENKVAARLYATLGFRESGEIEHGELFAWREPTQPQTASQTSRSEVSEAR